MCESSNSVQSYKVVYANTHTVIYMSERLKDRERDLHSSIKAKSLKPNKKPSDIKHIIPTIDLRLETHTYREYQIVALYLYSFFCLILQHLRLLFYLESLRINSLSKVGEAGKTMEEGRREDDSSDDCKQLPLPGPWVGHTFTLTLSHWHTHTPTHTP